MTNKITIHGLTININHGDKEPTFLGELKFAANDLAQPMERFSHALDGAAVVDSTTGLMWAAKTLPKCDHATALKNASAVDIGGHNDWRLPTRAELASLIDDTRSSPATDIEAFPDTKSDWYWTATPYAASSSDYAWLVHFNLGLVGNHLRGNDAFVRAVRAASPAGQ